VPERIKKRSRERHEKDEKKIFPRNTRKDAKRRTREAPLLTKERWIPTFFVGRRGSSLGL
jgi:hypothetical protein